MRFSFKFSNLCGSVYSGGNLVFTPDGNSVLSPVGNRISVFDLRNHKSSTLPFENRKNIQRLALSPDGNTLLSVDVDGRCLLINFFKRVVLAHFNFREPVNALEFSPDGKYFAVSHGHKVQLWKAPSLVTQFAPFSLVKTFPGHSDQVISLAWSPCSTFFMSGSKDTTVCLHTVHRIPGFVPVRLSGHRDYVVGCFFGQKNLFYTVGKEGSMFVWRSVPVDLPPGEESTTSMEDEEDGKSSSSALVEAKSAKAIPQPEVLAAACRFELAEKHYFNVKNAKVLCATVHRSASSTLSLLSVGFSNGVFSIYELPDFTQIHSLSISQEKISTVAVNSSGDWLAFGSAKLGQLLEKINTVAVNSSGDWLAFGAKLGQLLEEKICPVAVNSPGDWLAFVSMKLGQLLVWEWQSETYVLKQQGHFFDVNTLAYSPDGQLIATGGDDGKCSTICLTSVRVGSRPLRMDPQAVKLWNSSTGFCFVTFSEHTAPVQAVEFSSTGTVVISASLDGTVRAYDLVRYKNFRTMTSPNPTQFTSLSLDPSGELVCAGAQDPFEIYVWSLQTGRLLDVLAGHEGPISGIVYSPKQGLLASSSWDGTARTWSIFEGKASSETFRINSDVLGVAMRPDGAELCCASLDGQLTFWNIKDGRLTQTIEGSKDILGGRRFNDARSAKNSTVGRCFTSLCYSADGQFILAGGNSKFVCIYEISQKILVKKFQLSNNRSLDGVLDFLNSKHMTVHGPVDSDDDMEESEDDEPDSSLPGVKGGDFSSRTTKAAIRSKCVRFSPTGREFAVASTEGLLLYSLNTEMNFDPIELDIEITPDSIRDTLKRRNFARALVMSLRLNEDDIIREVVENTAPREIPLVVRSIPPLYLQRFLNLLAVFLESSPHLEFYMSWLQEALTTHGRYVQKQSNDYLTTLRTIHKGVDRRFHDLSKLCHSNQSSLDFLTRCGSSGGSTKRSSPMASDDTMTSHATSVPLITNGVSQADSDDDVLESDKIPVPKPVEQKPFIAKSAPFEVEVPSIEAEAN